MDDPIILVALAIVACTVAVCMELREHSRRADLRAQRTMAAVDRLSEHLSSVKHSVSDLAYNTRSRHKTSLWERAGAAAKKAAGEDKNPRAGEISPK